jgi:hypothetical protein
MCTKTSELHKTLTDPTRICVSKVKPRHSKHTYLEDLITVYRLCYNKSSKTYVVAVNFLWNAAYLHPQQLFE